jgi:hypothetical protein
MGAVDGRPLVWSGEGCYLHGDTRPIREGDFLHLCGKAGWLRGGCIAASPVPLLEITRGVLYVRPEYHPAEEPTLFRRVLGG